MAVNSPFFLSRGPGRRALAFAAMAIMAASAGALFVSGWISLETLVEHRAKIDASVREHQFLAILAFSAVYAAAVAISLPGAAFLTLAGGFLFGVTIGTCAAVGSATIGAIVTFLIARTALGEPLLRRAGPRVAKLASGFRQNAFSYLLFLRLVPAFPFFLVNLVPAFAGVGLGQFALATLLGIIPGSFVYALAGTGLESVIAAQESAYRDCIASGQHTCHLNFEIRNILTPELTGALIALGLLALLPVLVKHWRSRARLLN
jgi:uncharacterized membrane protein YdjX (TVP38/TMEM64 family)